MLLGCVEYNTNLKKIIYSILIYMYILLDKNWLLHLENINVRFKLYLKSSFNMFIIL